MKSSRTKIPRNNGQRKREALLAAGIAPSQFGKRKPAQPHRDRKHEAARGQRKHNGDWD